MKIKKFYQILINIFFSIAKFYDLRNEKEIESQKDHEYKYINILRNGDFVTFLDRFSPPRISIDTFSNQNKWTNKAIYEFDEKYISFGGVINDKMWIKANLIMFLLDLSTFKLQKVSLFVSFFFFII